MGGRFHLPALDWTSQEITSRLEKGLILTERMRERVNVILNQTDQVKFAKAEPSDITSYKVTDSIYQFIHMTKENPKPLNSQ